MPNNKSPGNDGLSKKIYETFWEEIKVPLCNSITKSYQNGELSRSQRQAVIKLIEKKDKDNKLIKNWDLFLYSLLIQNLFLKCLLRDLNQFFLL